MRDMIVRSFALAVTAFLFALPGQTLAQSRSVAWIEVRAAPGSKLGDIVRFERNRHKLADNEVLDHGLMAGDQVFLVGPDQSVDIRYLATNHVVRVEHARKVSDGSPDYVVVAPPIEGLFGKAADEVMAFGRRLNPFASDAPRASNASESLDPTVSRGLDGFRASAACPNTSGSSDKPLKFRVQSLNPYDNRIVAGQRALYVQWNGGVEPYSITLVGARNTVLAQLRNLRGTCNATLPEAMLAPGFVDLVLIDGKGAKAGAYNIAVLTNMPPSPPSLMKASLEPGALTLYRASLLSLQDKGAWQWEAMQLAHALDCHEPGVRDWLSAYGDPPACPLAPGIRGRGQLAR